MDVLLNFLTAILVLAFWGVLAGLVGLGAVAIYDTVMTRLSGEEWWS